MDERIRFAGRLLSGEKMAPLCREFGISRVTGYKDCGLVGLNDRNRAPYRLAEQNARHEIMHLTLRQEATKPAAFNFLPQQERFDDFIGVYNNERPYQALDGAYPDDL